MIKKQIQQLIADQTGAKPEDVKIEKPPKAEFGDYAVFIKNDVSAVFEKLKFQISNFKEIEKIEQKGNFVNFFLSTEFVQSELGSLVTGHSTLAPSPYAGKTVMVEYTDPNPFKLFHIGHLMSNAIGEAIARLHEAVGAKVLRVNYQGDVGLHVAKAVFALEQNQKLEDAYAYGTRCYDENPEERDYIKWINEQIYNRSSPEINKRYDEGRKASLEYFEKQYERLGTKFVHYFFESEMAPVGIEIIKAHPEVFVPSEGAIVFHGAHTRVFMNSQGLPTYEAKELGLNKTKFEQYHPDLSIIVTANEIVAYFNVLMEAMTLVMPDVAKITRHIPHGMMKLPTGKMSSRTGDVITADDFIEQVKTKTGSEETAIGAIKYSILKQGIGNDIVFDFEKSLTVNGDSGVYLQYTYARLASILAKAQNPNDKKLQVTSYKLHELTHPSELAVIKHLIEFPDAISKSAHDFAPNHLALYLYELANKANSFYEKVRILDDENDERKQARLVLVQTTANILKKGLEILGIKAFSKI